MTIVVNGQRYDLPDDATLTDAVALNGSVVPRGEWPRTTLVDADQVEILTAVQGG
jgi:sulfur carrier protein